MSEASTYQALRGHLAALRLAAAAEALPRLLDEAKAGRWSSTALLERLFALEVEAAGARRHATLARLACLPLPGGSLTSTSRPSPRSTKSSSWN
jgi:hypothetical protein